MSDIRELPLPYLSLDFEFTQKRFDALVRRASKVTDGRNLDFEVRIHAPDGSTFTLTSVSTEPMNATPVYSRQKTSLFEVLLCFFRGLLR